MSTLHAFATPAGKAARPAGRVAAASPAATSAARPHGRCSCGGGCPRCGGKTSPSSQLHIGAPDDSSEREADRAAAQIVSAAPAAVGSRRDPPRVSRKPAAGSVATGAAAPPIVEQVLGAQGRPLDAVQRAWFEPRLGRHLGAVRLHTDAQAAASAQAVAARAYTSGANVVFGAGQYAPHSAEGRRLLAHELVHVVQQGGDVAPQAAGGVSLQRSVVESPSSPGEGGELPLPFDPAPPSSEPAPASVNPEVCEPPDMGCTPTSEVPAASLEFIFAAGSATLNTAQKTRIDGVAAAWHAAGGVGAFRIDGYASAEGGCEMNWDLSCRRAQAVRNALLSPSDRSAGVSLAAVLTPLAHGESNAAGAALPANRRATISVPPDPTPDPDPDPDPEPDPDTPTPVEPTCALPVMLGTARGCGGGTDFGHFDFPALSTFEEALFTAWAMGVPGTILPRTSRWDITDAECERDMDGALRLFGGSPGHDAFSHFVSGGGTAVDHSPGDPLADEALAASTFDVTKELVRTEIESQLSTQAASGTLDACALSVTPPATSFRTTLARSLPAVIGGTQGETLFCTAFTGDAATRIYSISLLFEICDDFGVDNADLYGPGLFAFWALQHERSASRYMPFVNRLKLPVTLSGSF